MVDMINYYNKSSSSAGARSALAPSLNAILANYISEFDEQKIGNVIGTTRSQNKKYDIDLISKLLINGWYDECAYHDPLVGDPIAIIKPDCEESFNRLRFPSWRVAQAYYSIYHTTSAVVRLKEYSPDSSHNLILRSFTNHFASELDCFYPYPLSCYIKDGNFVNNSGLKYKEDEYRAILQELHELKKQKGKADAKSTNFLHLFRNFREWCNYNAGEVLILLKSKHFRDYLDINLRTLIYVINAMNEIYLIKFLGYERMVDIFEDFYKNNLINLKFEPKMISSRFSVYESNIDKIDKDFVLTNKAKNRYRKEDNIEILNDLGKSYFSKGWLFHSKKTFEEIILIDSSFDKAVSNLFIIEKHIEDLQNKSLVTYRSEYFEDRASLYRDVPREKVKSMKREREDRAKLLKLRVGIEWGKFFVQSESDPQKEYEVILESKVSCNCTDFKYRRKIIKECKHIKAARPVWNNMQLT